MVTVVSSTPRSRPATATGPSFSPVTVTVTVSTTVFSPSVVVSRKTSSVGSLTSGAVKVGESPSVFDSATLGPETCSQACSSARPSGSTADAESVTVLRSSASTGLPASMSGASLSAFTSTRTVSVTSCTPSLTVTSNRRNELLSKSGAVKLGVGVSASISVTSAPPIWRQETVSSPPSGSLIDADSCTSSFSLASIKGPASTVGGSLSASTVIVTPSTTSCSPSETTNSKDRSVFSKRFGAVNVGEGAVGSDSVTSGPPVCRQA